MFNIILGIIICLIVMSYNQEIVQFLINSGTIDSMIGYLESLKYQRWVITVSNVNIPLILYGDVSMDIIKNGFLFVTTVLEILEVLELDLLVRLKISKEL